MRNDQKAVVNNVSEIKTESRPRDKYLRVVFMKV